MIAGAAILSDPNFRSLLNLTARRCLSWDEFLGLPQPQDTSPLDTWEVLTEVNRCLGIPVNLPLSDGSLFWYRHTYQLDAVTRSLECACGPHSRLYSITSAIAGQHFLMEPRAEEFIAVAQLDGLEFDVQDAYRLLMLDRSPVTPIERVLINARELDDHLPDFADEPFSREFFQHMRATLADGVDESELPRRDRELGTIAGLTAEPDDYTTRMADWQADTIASFLNDITADPDEVNVLQVLQTADTFAFFRPVGPLSAMVGRLVARLFAIKKGVPLLGMLPLCRAKLRWEKGLIAPPLVSFDREMLAELRMRDMHDNTAYHTTAAQLALIELRALEASIQAWESRDAEMRRILRADHLLNARQRSVLARALRDEDAEFHTRYHQTTHNIHYATARRDLMELHEKGYLKMELRGKAYVFTRGPKLEELAATSTTGSPS
jgi:alkylhydroperoxidase/carboxymuconolactone decarboxylase family protein YurZ